MGRFFTVIAACLSLVFLSVVPLAQAEPIIQPVGNVQPPDGPAPAWIVADMDTGQVLAEREMNVAHPPASTIKTLLVLTALDELPNLDATVVGTEADTQVECSCAGIEPGRTYTARQLLDADPADVGQRRGQRARRHDRRLRHRGGEDERQGRFDRRAGHARVDTVRAGRPRRRRRHHAAGSGRHLPRRDGQSGVRPDHRAAGGDVPDR